MKPVPEQREVCGLAVPDRLTHLNLITLTNIVKSSIIDNMTIIVNMTETGQQKERKGIVELSGNTILITGGTSGIGLAAAKQFIKKSS